MNAKELNKTSLHRSAITTMLAVLSLVLVIGCIPVSPTEPISAPTNTALKPTAPPASPAPSRVYTPTAANNTPTADLSLTAVDAGRSVWLKPGQILKITLEGNPSTGYTWEVLPAESAVLTQVGEPEFKASSNLIGAPGMMTINLKATAEGRQNLKLVYHRTWEKDVPPTVSFEISVVVSQVQPPTPTSAPTLTHAGPTPTTVVFPAAGMTSWLTYSNQSYGFSFHYPADWKLSEGKGTMTGHAVLLTPASSSNISLRIAFKRTGEEAQIGRTGMGSGDLLQMGKVMVIGKEINRQVLIVQGKHMTVSYYCADCMVRGELEFRFDLDYGGSASDASALPAVIEAQADLIVASVKLSK